METFGRGCLYLIGFVVLVMILAAITQSTIHIPWFILIPVIILAFWIASKKSRK
ncbi:hypothetical protein [Cohnella hongkongensis]|uniref:Uncharacterized protein n=1 Tax=Cohnella hongkongensis TaxID=178337 RepID=A0ABV9F9D8_9BACL